MNRLIVVVGPTAVGKSDLAMQLAQRFDCEIISGDSMCVYRGLDIGTAKPSPADRRRIAHHLIDIRDPGESFSVVDFQKLAGEAIADINRRGKIPLLVGGTGLYVQALLEGYRFNPAPRSGQPEAALPADAADTAALHERLDRQDPAAAARIHPHDRKRILRALEVLTAEERPISQDKAASRQGLLYECLVFGIDMERPSLYRRIDARVDRMLADGLVEEAQVIWRMDLPETSTALQAIGYKELIDHFQGRISLAEAVERIKQASRRYAKRQLTWFRRMPYIYWLERPADDDKTPQTVFAVAERQVAEKFSIK